MKTRNLTIIAILIFASTSVFAQGNHGKKCDVKGQKKGNMCMNIPDLTDVQKTQLKDMRTANMKKMLSLKNELNEKQAHLKTVSSGDNVNMNEVNKTLEEISAIKLKKAKNKFAHRQEVRKILTKDQRVHFDMSAGNKMEKCSNGKKGKMNKKCKNAPCKK